MSFKSIIIGVFGVAVLLAAAYFLVFNSSQQAGLSTKQQGLVQNNSNLPKPPPMPPANSSILNGLGGGSQVLNFTFIGQKLKVGGYYVEFVNYSNDTAGFNLLDSNSNIIGGQTLVLNRVFSTSYYSVVLTSVGNNSATLEVKFNIPV